MTLVRRENAGDEAAIDAVLIAAFGQDGEARLVRELRASDAWIPPLSLVAEVEGAVVGHVVCSRGQVGKAPALGLGPIGIDPLRQRHGVGSALMHAVLGAADALDEPVVVLVGDPGYYARFGFVLAQTLSIAPSVPEWAPHFQARPLTAYGPDLQGVFTYAEPFMRA